MAKTVLSASLFAWACALAPATAGASCLMATLATFDGAYDAPAGGCTIGNLSFSDFLVEDAPGLGVVQLDPTTITLVPIAGGLGIAATAPLAAAAGEILGLRFGFRLTPPAPQALTGTLALGPSTVVPDGAITAIAFDGPTALATVYDIGVVADASEPLALPVASFFDVFVEIVIDGGPRGPSGDGGSALLGPSLGRITFESNGTGAVPEPGTAALAALALLALAGCRPRGRR